MSKETELKLLIAPEAHSQLLSDSLLNGTPLARISVRFSCKIPISIHPTNGYTRLGWRSVSAKKQGRFIQTLKTRGQSRNGLSQRGEWEWPLEADQLDTGSAQRGLA